MNTEPPSYPPSGMHSKSMTWQSVYNTVELQLEWALNARVAISYTV